MSLPSLFLARMQTLLGPDYPSFSHCFTQPPFRGIRLNPLKSTQELLKTTLPFPITPAPFAPASFYANWEEGFGRLPAHHAGMFYAQEPSATCAVTILAPRPGDRVLDLCAAPGGKSTQIAGLLKGRGLLWANEAVRSRAPALLSNLERLGVTNAVASSCHPQILCSGLRGYFDRVLVDAPCSGEGMFRRDPRAAEEWSPEHVKSCAGRQRAILDSAALAVAQGGVLVYSTCTFAPEENEDTALWFLEHHPEFIGEEITVSFGRPGRAGNFTRRIYPMDGGEGHFAAKFRRVGENPCQTGGFGGYLTGSLAKEGRELYQSLFTDDCPPAMAQVKDTLLLVPEDLPELRGLGVLRAGVELCRVRKGRLEPAHGVFMSRGGGVCREVVDFEPESGELAGFLRGEEVECEGRGWKAVCVKGVTTGFGKASGGRLKNWYPKGLRNLR